MRTMVRACVRPGMREALREAAQKGGFPPGLMKAFGRGRYEGDVCYFTVGGLLGDPWPQLKPAVERYFEIEWERPEKDVEADERTRISKLHTLRAKLGLGH